MKFLLPALLISGGLLVLLSGVKSKETSTAKDTDDNPVASPDNTDESSTDDENSDPSKNNSGNSDAPKKEDKPVEKEDDSNKKDKPVEKEDPKVDDKKDESKQTDEKKSKPGKKKPKKSKEDENEEEEDDDEKKAKEINDSLSLVKKLKCKELKKIQKNINGDKDDEDEDDDYDYDYYYDLLTSLLYGSFYRKRRDIGSGKVRVTSEGSLKLPPSFRYFRIGGQSSDIPTSIESPLAELISKPSNGQLLDVLGIPVSEDVGKIQTHKGRFQNPVEHDQEHHGEGFADPTATTVSGNQDQNDETSDFKELTGIVDAQGADDGKEFIGPLDYDGFREAYYRLGFVGPLGPGGLESNIPLSHSTEPAGSIPLSTEDVSTVSALLTVPTETVVPHLPEGWLVR